MNIDRIFQNRDNEKTTALNSVVLQTKIGL